MLKKISLFCLFLLFVFTAKSQQSLNINLLSNIDYNNDLSDVWGYANDNGEYALVGVNNGISVVDVTNPVNPNEIGFFPGPESMWRDLKTWGNYLYCINDEDGDGGAGLQILNLEELINGVSNPTYIENMSLGFETAHNIYIDENGVLYVFGANYGIGGALMYNLVENPENPPLLGVFNDYYLHDGMARGDTLWGGAINDGVFTVIDVSDKQNPLIIGSHPTPNNFSHNCWISDDGNYLFTTDEVSGAYVAAYDVSNLNDIEEVDRIQAWSPQTNVIPHNTHVDGDFIVTSYYTDGVSVVDVSNPSNMVEVGYFDTSENYSGGGFNGAWGAYPWLPSGNLLITDIETGLYVLEPKYSNASFIEGYVLDAYSDAPVSNVQVQIVGSNNSYMTDLNGFFELGTATDGTYELLFTAPGYSDITYTINLVAGDVLDFDVQLEPLQTFQSQISVLNSLNLYGVENASFHIYNDLFNSEFISDEAGLISTYLMEGVYNVSIGAWGYQTLCTQLTISEQLMNHSFQLDQVYSDDFYLDLGWEVESDASLTSGAWEREIPTVIPLHASVIQTFPIEDVDGDCGNYAFVTGNTEFSSSEFEVQNANWGGSIENMISAPISIVDDQDDQACHNIAYDLTGSIALISRGGCEFGLKALNAENSGAIAVIIYNNNNGPAPNMGAGSNGNQVSIPVFSMSGSDGLDLLDLLGNISNYYISLSEQSINVTVFESNDVDLGYTRITSPLMDMTNYANPVISFYSWFQNTGVSSPNDSLLFKLTNGTETVLVASRTALSSSSEWQFHDIPIDGLLELNDQMQFIVETMDDNMSNHIVEAGFDRFMVTSSNLDVPSSQHLDFKVYPNPSNSRIISIESPELAFLSILDISGKLVFESSLIEGVNTLNLIHLNSGLYVFKLKSGTISNSIMWLCH